MGSQAPMKYSCTCAPLPSPHHVGPLTWNSNTKVLWVLCHHLLLQLVQSGSQRPWETTGRLTRVPTELPPHPSKREPCICPQKCRASPTNQDHQARPLTRLVLVPGYLLIGQQLRRLGYCGHLSFLGAPQSLPSAQPEASPKTGFGGRAGGTMALVPGSPREDCLPLARPGRGAGSHWPLPTTCCSSKGLITMHSNVMKE